MLNSASTWKKILRGKKLKVRMEKPKENKGLFWDHVNKRFYRWHELKLLMQERRLKENETKQNKESGN